MFARFISGVSGGAFCLISNLKLISHSFPEKRVTFATGIVIAIGVSGGMVAQFPMVLLLNSMDWRDVVFLLGSWGVFIILLIFLLVHPNTAKESVEHKKAISMTVFQGIFQVILRLQNWLCVMYISFGKCAITVCYIIDYVWPLSCYDRVGYFIF